jgi:hypothetical protein
MSKCSIMLGRRRHSRRPTLFGLSSPWVVILVEPDGFAKPLGPSRVGLPQRTADSGMAAYAVRHGVSVPNPLPANMML